jgi:hypothetical protein
MFGTLVILITLILVVGILFLVCCFGSCLCSCFYKWFWSIPIKIIFSKYFLFLHFALYFIYVLYVFGACSSFVVCSFRIMLLSTFTIILMAVFGIYIVKMVSTSIYLIFKYLWIVIHKNNSINPNIQNSHPIKIHQDNK